MRLAVLLVAAVALLAPGCGHKNSVIAPELVRPEPPTEFNAASTPDGVRLTWTRPTRYTGGSRMRDLGSFRIERADTERTPLEFSFAGELEMKDQTRYRQARRLEYFDKDVIEGHEYVYRVRARTTDGYDSPWSGPARVRFKPGSAAADTQP
jgi:fibronectin type III domain protein